uniref:Protein kinase APK1A, chloroplastic n=1 Tax=Aegilops tauschii TaxID=37682 RepID=R7WD50_AEGTA
MAIAIAVHHLLLALALFPLTAAQQEYQANGQSDCYVNNGSSVLGYTCTNTSSSPPACATYVAFRSDLPSFGSPITVAYLLNASAPAVAAANNVPVASLVRNNTLLLVPVPCACTAAGRYQHDTAYAVQYAHETYFSIANYTYQGLSTCQALMAQNPARDSDIYPGVALTVPLRCACPSVAQAAAGGRYLVTYVLDWDDYALTVAQRFGADYQALLRANSIDEDTTVYPFTTMLVPLKDPPTNLKSSNILLDACFRAKLSNFGLARAITIDDDAEDGGLWMTRHMVGTQGYLAPEYVEHGLIGPQLDVFAFGVVLLQLLSGKEAAVAPPDNDGKVVLLWEEAEGLGRLGEGDGAKDDLIDRVTAFIDGRLHGQYPFDVAAAMLASALRCVAREPRARPPMAKVLLSLSGMYSTIGP